MSDGHLSQVRTLRLAALTMFVLGVLTAIDRLVEPAGGWGMALKIARALGNFLAAGVFAIALLTLRDRWVWWLGLAFALLGVVIGLHYLFPGPTETVSWTWAVEGVLGLALFALLLMPSSRAAFRRSSVAP